MSISPVTIFLTLSLTLTIIKLININLIPIFGDEAVHLYFAEIISKNPALFLNSLEFGVYPIFIWLLSILMKVSFYSIDPLILGRATNIFIDFFTSIFIFMIGKKLLNQSMGIMAGLVYLSLPITFFHGRFSLLEPLTTLLITIAIFLYINNKKWSSLFMILSFFTKPLSLILIPGFVLFPLFQPNFF